ncbi:ankyrin repeat-containing domain protein [Lasiosphaeria hispida]|uniref:Ankyrin repeat-containing domain protein n=1 Tax=Lasiosphaeria hispida TaxID=260671 RepID=A0AAJ0HAK0_9PEZI|nr:ankyrin repeat-containing domain protein [Lasiosphaeria hispida]
MHNAALLLTRSHQWHLSAMADITTSAPTRISNSAGYFQTIPMLSHLPTEILLHLISSSEDMLSPKEHMRTLYSLTATCRKFRAIFEMQLYRFDINKQGSSVMSWAAAKGRTNVLEKAFSYGADVDGEGPHRGARLEVLSKISLQLGEEALSAAMVRMQATPLHYAIVGAHDEAVEWLLNHGAETNKASVGLFGAEFGGDLEKWKRYVDSFYEFGPGAQPGHDPPTWLPLHLALCHGNTSVAKLLTRYEADVGPGCPNPEFWWDDERLDALQCAVHYGNSEMVRHLLAEVDPNLVNAREASSRSTALHVAAGFYVYNDDMPVEKEEDADRTEIIKALVEYGADLDIRDHIGRTPLNIAVNNADLHIASYLLGLGADHRTLTINDIQSVYHGRDEMVPPEFVRKLISLGADVNNFGSLVLPPLFVAVENFQYEVANIILEAGANPEPPSAPGSNQILFQLLHHIKFKDRWTQQGGDTLFRALLAKGLDLNIRRPLGLAQLNMEAEVCLTYYLRTRSQWWSEGNTISVFPPAEEMLHVVSSLLGYGANPNAVNSAGMSPIHCLIECYIARLSKSTTINKDRQELGSEVWYSSSFRKLLQSGASLGIRDARSKTALDRAAKIAKRAGKHLLDRKMKKKARRDGHDIMRFLLRNVQPGNIPEEERCWALEVVGHRGKSSPEKKRS